MRARMSATLVHGNTSITLLSGSRSSGVNVITPVMAVSMCRPAIGNGMPSRRGSAISRSQLPAQSLSSHTHFNLHSHESIPAAISLSSSLLEPYPPDENTTWASESRESLTLPRIRSPTQLCSTSNSQSSVITTIDATIDGRDRVSDVDAHLDKPHPPSIFPNFRALQRLAASAKLRINNLKSKEAKAITALLNQENNNQSSESLSCQDHDMIGVNNVLNSSWESRDDDHLQPLHMNSTDSAAYSDKGTSKSKSKKFHRSRSRRRRGKTPSRKKNSPAPKKDINSLGDFTLASTITLNSRFERKKMETFSTKYSKNFTSRKAKAKDSSSGGASSQLSLMTVALEKRSTASTPCAITKQSRFEASDMPTSRMVLEHAATVYRSGNQVSVRLSNKFRSSESEHSVLKKVFLSEKQSSMLKDCGKGVPCAPPASPTPQQLEKFEYVPSLTDLRSQRALKDKLIVIDAEEKKKSQKTCEERARQEKLTVRSNVSLMRQRQRQEIYALNKVMTELEFGQFQKFCDLMTNKGNS